jgi:hypothetical protein
MKEGRDVMKEERKEERKERDEGRKNERKKGRKGRGLLPLRVVLARASVPAPVP